MQVAILTHGGFGFLKGMTFPFTAECCGESPRCYQVTTEALREAGVDLSPHYDKLMWNFRKNIEAVRIPKRYTDEN